MSAVLFEENDLQAISPDTLMKYAEAAGWKKVGEYGSYSYIYGADDKPEILIPHTADLADYIDGVSRLIRYFAAAADKDAQSVFRDLTYARCDVIRARAGGDQDSLPFNAALDLINGSNKLLAAALRSLNNRKKAYKGQIGKNAELLDKIRFGQTEKGSLVITLLTPPIEPSHEETQAAMETVNDPMERRLTRHLMQALDAARTAVDQTAKGESEAFERAVEKGVSANLCEALVEMATPFPSLCIETTWAKTLPMNTERSEARFVKDDVGVLEKAAAELKAQ